MPRPLTNGGTVSELLCRIIRRQSLPRYDERLRAENAAGVLDAAVRFPVVELAVYAQAVPLASTT